MKTGLCRPRAGIAQSVNSDLLRAGRSGDRIPVGSRFSAPVQTGPEAHSASYTMGTGFFPGVKMSGRSVDHPPSFSADVKERVQLYLLLPLWVFVACSRMNVTCTNCVVPAVENPLPPQKIILRRCGTLGVILRRRCAWRHYTGYSCIRVVAFCNDCIRIVFKSNDCVISA